MLSAFKGNAFSGNPIFLGRFAAAADLNTAALMRLVKLI